MAPQSRQATSDSFIVNIPLKAMPMNQGYHAQLAYLNSLMAIQFNYLNQIKTEQFGPGPSSEALLFESQISAQVKQLRDYIEFFKTDSQNQIDIDGRGRFVIRTPAGTKEFENLSLVYLKKQDGSSVPHLRVQQRGGNTQQVMGRRAEQQQTGNSQIRFSQSTFSQRALSPVNQSISSAFPTPTHRLPVMPSGTIGSPTTSNWQNMYSTSPSTHNNQSNSHRFLGHPQNAQQMHQVNFSQAFNFFPSGYTTPLEFGDSRNGTPMRLSRTEVVSPPPASSVLASVPVTPGNPSPLRIHGTQQHERPPQPEEPLSGQIQQRIERLRRAQAELSLASLQSPPGSQVACEEGIGAKPRNEPKSELLGQNLVKQSTNHIGSSLSQTISSVNKMAQDEVSEHDLQKSLDESSQAQAQSKQALRLNSLKNSTKSDVKAHPASHLKYQSKQKSIKRMMTNQGEQRQTKVMMDESGMLIARQFTQQQKPSYNMSHGGASSFYQSSHHNQSSIHASNKQSSIDRVGKHPEGDTSSTDLRQANLGIKLDPQQIFLSKKKKLSFARSAISTETPDFHPDFNFNGKPSFLDSPHSKRESFSPDPKLLDNEQQSEFPKGLFVQQNDEGGPKLQSELKGKLGEFLKKQTDHDKEAANSFKKIMNLLKQDIKKKFKDQDKIDGYQSFLEEKKQQDKMKGRLEIKSGSYKQLFSNKAKKKKGEDSSSFYSISRLSKVEMSRLSDANGYEWSNKKGRLTRVQANERTKRITLGSEIKETSKNPVWRNSEASPRRLTSSNAPDFVSQRAEVDSEADYQTGPNSHFNFRPSQEVARPSPSKLLRPSMIGGILEGSKSDDEDSEFGIPGMNDRKSTLIRPSNAGNNFAPFISKFDEIIEEQSNSMTSNSGSSSSVLSDMRYRLKPPNIFVLGLDDESVELPPESEEEGEQELSEAKEEEEKSSTKSSGQAHSPSEKNSVIDEKSHDSFMSSSSSCQSKEEKTKKPQKKRPGPAPTTASPNRNKSMISNQIQGLANKVNSPTFMVLRKGTNEGSRRKTFINHYEKTLLEELQNHQLFRVGTQQMKLNENDLGLDQRKMKHLKQLRKRLSILEETEPEAYQKIKTKIMQAQEEQKEVITSKPQIASPLAELAMPSVKEENFKWGAQHLMALTSLINNSTYICKCAPDQDNDTGDGGNEKKGMMDSGLPIIHEEGDDEDKKENDENYDEKNLKKIAQMLKPARNPKMSITTIEEVDYEHASSVAPSIKGFSMHQSDLGKGNFGSFQKPPILLQRQRTSQVYLQENPARKQLELLTSQIQGSENEGVQKFSRQKTQMVSKSRINDSQNLSVKKIQKSLKLFPGSNHGNPKSIGLDSVSEGQFSQNSENINSSNSRAQNRQDQASNKSSAAHKNSTSKSHVRSEIRLKKGLEWGEKEKKANLNLDVSEVPIRCARRSTSNLFSDSNSLSSRAGSAYQKQSSVSPRTKKKPFQVKMKDNLSSNEESDFKRTCSPQGSILQPNSSAKPLPGKRFSALGTSKSLFPKAEWKQKLDSQCSEDSEEQSSVKKVACMGGKKFMFTHDFLENHPMIRAKKDTQSAYSLIRATKHIKSHIAQKGKIGAIFDEIIKETKAKKGNDDAQGELFLTSLIEKYEVRSRSQPPKKEKPVVDYATQIEEIKINLNNRARHSGQLMLSRQITGLRKSGTQDLLLKKLHTSLIGTKKIQKMKADSKNSSLNIDNARTISKTRLRRISEHTSQMMSENLKSRKKNAEPKSEMASSGIHNSSASRKKGVHTIRQSQFVSTMNNNIDGSKPKSVRSIDLKVKGLNPKHQISIDAATNSNHQQQSQNVGQKVSQQSFDLPSMNYMKPAQESVNWDIDREDSSEVTDEYDDSYDDEYDEEEDLESFCNNLSRYQIIEIRSRDHSMIMDDDQNRADLESESSQSAFLRMNSQSSIGGLGLQSSISGSPRRKQAQHDPSKHLMNSEILSCKQKQLTEKTKDGQKVMGTDPSKEREGDTKRQLATLLTLLSSEAEKPSTSSKAKDPSGDKASEEDHQNSGSFQQSMDEKKDSLFVTGSASKSKKNRRSPNQSNDKLTFEQINKFGDRSRIGGMHMINPLKSSVTFFKKPSVQEDVRKISSKRNKSQIQHLNQFSRIHQEINQQKLLSKQRQIIDQQNKALLHPNSIRKANQKQVTIHSDKSSVQSGGKFRVISVSGRSEVSNMFKSHFSVSTNSRMSKLSKKGCRLMLNQYVVMYNLGEGNLGQSRKAIDTKTRQYYAMKVILSKKRGSLLSVDQHKVALFKKAAHPHLCGLHEAIHDKKANKLTLFCPFAPKSNLKNRIEGIDPQPITEKGARKYFRQLISAVWYCHTIAGSPHGAITPTNLLFDAKDDLLLSDYGHQAIIGMQPGSLKNPEFLSPEECDQNLLLSSPEIDMWNTGIVLYYITFGKLPFIASTEKELRQLILSEEPEFNFLDIFLLDSFNITELAMLIKALLRKDPRKRPTAHELQKNPWLTNFKNEQCKWNCYAFSNISRWEPSEKELSLAVTQVHEKKSVMIRKK